MIIKKGDKIKVLSGKDKGKTGKVLQIFPLKNKASIEGINLLIKHLRPKRQGDKGQRVEFPAPMDMSNLMLVCPKCARPSRISHKTVQVGETNKKYRVCKKCQASLE
jgi:large subunit ribosomal protein L24